MRGDSVSSCREAISLLEGGRGLKALTLEVESDVEYDVPRATSLSKSVSLSPLPTDGEVRTGVRVRTLVP